MGHGFGAIGYIAALLTTFSSIPQIIRVIKLKESRDISLWNYIFVVCRGPSLGCLRDYNRGFTGDHGECGLSVLVDYTHLPCGKISMMMAPFLLSLYKSQTYLRQ
jgi:hypothetical protein